MTSLLQIQLQNTKERYETLAKQGRKDLIAAIVLNRIQDEINTFERRISNEEKPRQEVHSRTSISRFTRYFKQAIHRYRPKFDRNHHAIPSIPAIDTL